MTGQSLKWASINSVSVLLGPKLVFKPKIKAQRWDYTFFSLPQVSLRLVPRLAYLGLFKV